MTGLDHIIFDYAMAHVGKPYIWGGDDSIKGYDCSGFMLEMLAVRGYTFPRDMTAENLFDHFFVAGSHSCNSKDLGSLVFYGREGIKHVAMSIGNHMIVEAAGGGRNTKTCADAIRDNAYIRIRPCNYRNDFICIIMPKYKPIGHYYVEV